MRTVKQSVRPAKNNVIPIFFACDDRYAPYLGVALRSLIDHASPRYTYRIYVLINVLSDDNKEKLLTMQNERTTIEFVNVRDKLDGLGSMLHLRDYYTQATYYRFFIPDLFPQYRKGLYLDCDILVLGDISRLWRIDLGLDLCAAIPEEVMGKVNVFGEYVEQVLGIPREEYFSAGILLMNLAEMRRFRLEEAFVELLGRRTYRVTQDQDYLNVLCYNRVHLVGTEWNYTAFPDSDNGPLPEIIHFKINWKPWHYEGVAFESYFWSYADETPFAADIHATLNSYTEAERDRDSRQYDNLVKLAQNEIEAAAGEQRLPEILPLGGILHRKGV